MKERERKKKMEEADKEVYESERQWRKERKREKTGKR